MDDASSHNDRIFGAIENALEKIAPVKASIDAMPHTIRYFSPKTEFVTVHKEVVNFIENISKNAESALPDVRDIVWPKSNVPYMIAKVMSVTYPAIGGQIHPASNPTDNYMLRSNTDHISKPPQNKNSYFSMAYELELFAKSYADVILPRAKYITECITEHPLPHCSDIEGFDSWIQQASSVLAHITDLSVSYSNTTEDDTCQTVHPAKDCCTAHSIMHSLHEAMNSLYETLRAHRYVKIGKSFKTAPNYDTVTVATLTQTHIIIPAVLGHIVTAPPEGPKEKLIGHWAQMCLRHPCPPDRDTDFMPLVLTPAQLKEGMSQWRTIIEHNYTRIS